MIGDGALAARVAAAWAEWRAAEHEEGGRAAESAVVVLGPDGRVGLAEAEAGKLVDHKEAVKRLKKWGRRGS